MSAVSSARRAWARARTVLSGEDGSIVSSAGFVTMASLAAASVLALVLSTTTGATAATQATNVDGAMSVAKAEALAELMGDEVDLGQPGLGAQGEATVGAETDTSATVSLLGKHAAWDSSRQVASSLNVTKGETTHVAGFDASGRPIWVKQEKAPPVFIDIAASGDYACGLDQASTAWCWGSNSNAQLGNGTRADAPAPTRVAPVSGAPLRFTELSEGTEFSICGIEAGPRSLWCWGNNTNGQLGDTSGYLTSPVKLDEGPIAKVAQSSNTTCAIDAGDQSLRCWGLNTGQADAGHTPSGFDGKKFVDVALDALNAYALEYDPAGAHKLWVWTLNSKDLVVDTVAAAAGGGPGGVGASVPRIVPAGQPGVLDSEQPREVAGVSGLDALFIAPEETGLRESVACGIDEDLTTGLQSNTWCWGGAAHDQLGEPDTTPDQLDPLRLPGLTKFTDLALTTDTVAGITTTGRVHTWGADGSGQLGNGTSTSPRTSPASVLGMAATAVSIEASTGGSNTFCAATDAREVWCWGENGYGQAGQDPVTNDPVTVPTPVSGQVATEAAMGDAFTAVASDRGVAAAWGRNNLGQRGNTDAATVWQPGPVDDIDFIGETMTQVAVTP